MTSAASVNGTGEIWLVHLSSTRPEPDTVERVGLVDVSRSSTLTVAVGEDDSTVQLLEPQDLPPGELAEVGERHVKATAVALADVLAPTPGPVVLAAVDRVAHLASWDIVQELDQVVVADTLDAAVRVVAMLRAGTDLDEVLHPPGFSVALSVADAGIGSPAGAETLVTVDEGPLPPESSWLTFRDQDLEVRTHGMDRWSARAVTARAGDRKSVV